MISKLKTTAKRVVIIIGVLTIVNAVLSTIVKAILKRDRMKDIEEMAQNSESYGIQVDKTDYSVGNEEIGQDGTGNEDPNVSE